MTAFTRFPNGRGAREFPPPPAATRTMEILVGPFVVAFVPGTTRGTRTNPPLPCKGFAGSRRSYLGPAPPLWRLDHPTDFVGHRLPAGCQSGSQVSDDLRPVGHVASRRYPAGRSPDAAPSRADIVCTGVDPCDFGGPKLEAPPYPSACSRSRFGTVSDRTHWQALGGPLVVELFAVGFLSPERRGLSGPRFRPSPGRKLPTPAALNEPHGTRTRIAPEGCGPDPAGGIRTRFAPSRPQPLRARSVPVAPRRAGRIG